MRGALHLRKRFPEAKKAGSWPFSWSTCLFPSFVDEFGCGPLEFGLETWQLAFSSSSGLFGVPGQSTYAAGNTFVDQVMPSIQWGGWGETGMVEDLGIVPLPGERFISVAKGLECLGRVLDASPRAVPLAVLDVHWPSFRRQPQVFAADDPLLATIEAQEPSAQVQPLKKEWLLGGAGCRWRGSLQVLELCQQHVVSGVPLLPGSALLALAIEAAQQLLQSDTVQLQERHRTPISDVFQCNSKAVC